LKNLSISGAFDMKPQDVIIRRVVKEISGKQGVALGPGIAELVAGVVPSDTKVFRMDGTSPEMRDVKLAVVEVAQVSQSGRICLKPESSVSGVRAEKWVVATFQTDARGNPRIVRNCRYPVASNVSVSKIITEKAVIEVTESGLVLKEILPGISTDDVKKETGASLHIADDIKLMEL
jgi:acyl CoA:acetate/3-ketoacid CoA transferase beta subunit